jgi:CDP-6-deoxy-D-xylo-4-hexulose-3-dehydrase
MNEEAARKKIREAIREFYARKRKQFVPGKSKVQYAGAVMDANEAIAAADALLDGWLGLGKQAHRFEQAFSRFLGGGETVLTNSGSSANLLAVSALASRQRGSALKPGDEVITPAATFPTTFNPIVQNGLKPVLLDVELGTYNINAEHLRSALSEKTRAIMLPHAFGNPNEMDAVMDFAAEHDLLIVEDSCDALGSAYAGRKTGTFGALATFSFYPAHQMTTGEGGAVVANARELAPVVRSLRDWGRACVCPVCKISLDHDATCPLRFESKTKTLPADYDRRYTYVDIGYNLKPTEMQAAIGVEQLRKLPGFVAKRKENFRFLLAEFERYEDSFVLPAALRKSEPCWFCFPLTVRGNAPFKRSEIVQWLEKRNIETRLFFAGNIVRQPAYEGIDYRVAEDLRNSDTIMRDSFFLGVYPGLAQEQLDYVAESVKEFMAMHR